MKKDSWDSALYDDRHSFVWKSGAGLLELLNPQAGERILDVGSGTGHLTAQIAERGAEVLGIDSSASMVALARQNFPRLRFELADIRNFQAAEPFDAVFSNAVLHWVREAEAAIQSMARATVPGGRLVMEMGGEGNTAKIVAAVEGVLRGAGYRGTHRWYYPSVAEYSALLGKNGFRVETAENFPRWTKLEHPERGMREWLEMFGQAWFEDVPAHRREELMRAIEDRLRPDLWSDGNWYADYRRLRVTATRSSL